MLGLYRRICRQQHTFKVPWSRWFFRTISSGQSGQCLHWNSHSRIKLASLLMCTLWKTVCPGCNSVSINTIPCRPQFAYSSECPSKVYGDGVPKLQYCSGCLKQSSLTCRSSPRYLVVLPNCELIMLKPQLHEYLPPTFISTWLQKKLWNNIEDRGVWRQRRDPVVTILDIIKNIRNDRPRNKFMVIQNVYYILMKRSQQTRVSIK